MNQPTTTQQVPIFAQAPPQMSPPPPDMSSPKYMYPPNTTGVPINNLSYQNVPLAQVRARSNKPSTKAIMFYVIGYLIGFACIATGGGFWYYFPLCIGLCIPGVLIVLSCSIAYWLQFGRYEQKETRDHGFQQPAQHFAPLGHNPNVQYAQNNPTFIPTATPSAGQAPMAWTAAPPGTGYAAHM